MKTVDEILHSFAIACEDEWDKSFVEHRHKAKSELRELIEELRKKYNGNEFAEGAIDDVLKLLEGK